MLSLLLGLGIVFLIVFLDRSIKSRGRRSAGRPARRCSASSRCSTSRDIPTSDDRARDLYVHQHPTSRVAECCRSLRTNILFSAADRQIKTIVVSSANPREGKTTRVIYLGTTMAQSGQRVLLIDTDMRRPRLHVSLGVPRQTGLSNLIVGDRDYDDGDQDHGGPEPVRAAVRAAAAEPGRAADDASGSSVVLEELASGSIGSSSTRRRSAW